MCARKVRCLLAKNGEPREQQCVFDNRWFLGQARFIRISELHGSLYIEFILFVFNSLSDLYTRVWSLQYPRWIRARSMIDARAGNRRPSVCGTQSPRTDAFGCFFYASSMLTHCCKRLLSSESVLDVVGTHTHTHLTDPLSCH